MESLFIATSVTLVALLIFRAIEEWRDRRHMSGLRGVVDTYTTRIACFLRSIVTAVARYAHSGVLMRVLHVITYGTLHLIRGVEHLLVRAVHSLRRFRHSRQAQADKARDVQE